MYNRSESTVSTRDEMEETLRHGGLEKARLNGMSMVAHDMKSSLVSIATVKAITEAHSGRVLVESEPDKGTTFSVRLPRAEPERVRDETPRRGRSAQPEAYPLTL